MVPKIFVSATNTNIGKTYTMQLLIKALSSKGYQVGVIKPIETGVDTFALDAKAIFDTAKTYNKRLSSLTLDDICPYQFTLPAAPFVAKGDIHIDLDVIKASIDKIASLCDIVLIEGAGGLLVPIQEDEKIINMALELADALLLVVPSRLGSINDTLLNLELLKQYDLPFEWVINLFEDKEHFETITQPYYEEKYPDHMILQKDMDVLVEKLLQTISEK